MTCAKKHLKKRSPRYARAARSLSSIFQTDFCILTYSYPPTAPTGPLFHPHLRGTAMGFGPYKRYAKVSCHAIRPWKSRVFSHAILGFLPPKDGKHMKKRDLCILSVWRVHFLSKRQKVHFTSSDQHVAMEHEESHWQIWHDIDIEEHYSKSSGLLRISEPQGVFTRTLW